MSIQYQTLRDLIGIEREDLKARISIEGWGKELLTKRNSDGHWGMRFYQPKWTSTHYSLLDLRNLNPDQNNRAIKDTIDMVLDSSKSKDGGISLGPSTLEHSDVCVNGMFLNYASYFRIDEKKLASLVDSILNEIMPDGGFNCITSANGSTHSSLHTTLSVLEGLYEFQKNGYNYRIDELLRARDSGEEFILIHHLFKSDKTGEVINRNFLRMPYPGRWKYDILRAMDYFQYSGKAWDSRMGSAMEIISKKQRADGRWNQQAGYPGKVHFEMEKAGKPGRWNTLRALRIIKKYNKI